MVLIVKALFVGEVFEVLADKNNTKKKRAKHVNPTTFALYLHVICQWYFILS